MVGAERIRKQAVHPFRDLPSPTGWSHREGEYVTACLHPLPLARVVEPQEISSADVELAVAEARAIVGDNGGSVLIWWLAPEHYWLGEHLERCGLVNEATPGFEATESAMALVDAPRGEVPTDVGVKLVESFEEFASAESVQAEVFGIEADAPGAEQGLALRFEQYSTPGNPLRQFNAVLDGRVVGTATAVAGDAGLNLFGGAVLSEARDRGVYRALIRARWDLAVAYGTSCLTVQAGGMSRPILERAGFTFLESVRVYVDNFTGG